MFKPDVLSQDCPGPQQLLGGLVNLRRPRRRLQRRRRDVPRPEGAGHGPRGQRGQPRDRGSTFFVQTFW